MIRSPLLCVLLLMAGCALRVGTDPAAETAPPPPLCMATWSRDAGDSIITLRIDTLDLLSPPLSTELSVPESTFLAVVALDEPGGAWLGSGATSVRLREAASFHLRWRDDALRTGWIFTLPGTGVERGLTETDAWIQRTIPVFADTWPARIYRTVQGRRLVWSIDSVRLTDTLELDLSALPDSSCPIQPVLGQRTWECVPR